MLMRHRPFRLVDVEGDPRERGRQHGAEAAERVMQSAALYLKSLEGLGIGPARSKSLVEEFAGPRERRRC
jgi:isopenicillin-N N-acyltransferase like protein